MVVATRSGAALRAFDVLLMSRNAILSLLLNISSALQVFRISGGNDKQGFPMKQGVLSANRVRLLLHKGVSCYRQRRRGERKRKSVRGCIVAADLAVLNLVITKKGEQDIPGLTDAPVPRRLGPKRANKIRKLFNLGKVRSNSEHGCRIFLAPPMKT